MTGSDMTGGGRTGGRTGDHGGTGDHGEAGGMGLWGYLRVLRVLWRSSLQAELEYRANFLANVALSLFWLVWAVLGARVLYRFTGQIAGWRYEEALVVLGVFFALNGVWQAVIEPNLTRMGEYVRRGTLDHLLTQPISSQFLVSLRYLGVHNWADPLLGLGLAGAGVAASGHRPDAGDLTRFAVLAVAAVVLLYSVALALQTLTILTVASEGVGDLVWAVVETGRFPVAFYGGPVRRLLTVVLPVAFLTTYPAEALLGRASWPVAALAATVATTAFLAASALWRLALRAYTGASA